MKQVSTYIMEYKFAYLFAVVSMVISISLDMLSPQPARHIVDDVIIGEQLALLTPLLTGILCIGIGRFIFQYAKKYTFDLTNSHITLKVRKNQFLHIQSAYS